MPDLITKKLEIFYITNLIKSDILHEKSYVKMYL